MKRVIPFTVAVLATVLVLAGCTKSTGIGTSSHHINPSALATNSAVASAKAEAKVKAKAEVKKCVPADSLRQISLGHQLLTDTKKHPNGSRHQLLSCMGISKANEKPAEAAALAAAEKVNWASKDARHQYFGVTLPAIVVQYGAAVPVSTPATPSVAASR